MRADVREDLHHGFPLVIAREEHGALIVTGIMIWQEYFPSIVSIPTRRIAVAIHALAAVGVCLIFIAHVYAAFWTRGTISAMTRGTVTGGWAWKHHRKWLRELAGRERQGQPK